MEAKKKKKSRNKLKNIPSWYKMFHHYNYLRIPFVIIYHIIQVY